MGCNINYVLQRDYYYKIITSPCSWNSFRNSLWMKYKLYIFGYFIKLPFNFCKVCRLFHRVANPNPVFWSGSIFLNIGISFGFAVWTFRFKIFVAISIDIYFRDFIFRQQLKLYEVWSWFELLFSVRIQILFFLTVGSKSWSTLTGSARLLYLQKKVIYGAFLHSAA